MSIRSLLALHLVTGLGAACILVTAGCGPGGNVGPVTCLADDFPADAGSPPAGSTLNLTVGSEDPTHTRVAAAWQDGDHVALVSGGQGGFMIRPALDVVAPVPLTESAGHAACLRVHMIATSPASAYLSIGSPASRIAGTASTYHVPALFGLLSFGGGVDGVAIPVTFDVHAPGYDGHAEVTVVPDSSLAR